MQPGETHKCVCLSPTLTSCGRCLKPSPRPSHLRPGSAVPKLHRLRISLKVGEKKSQRNRQAGERRPTSGLSFSPTVELSYPPPFSSWGPRTSHRSYQRLEQRPCSPPPFLSFELRFNSKPPVNALREFSF